MRIAILADIHGNQIGLEAVLAELDSKNVDGYWFLGDYCENFGDYGDGEDDEIDEDTDDLSNDAEIAAVATELETEVEQVADDVDLDTDNTDEAREALTVMCERLLANTVIEDFEISL